MAWYYFLDGANQGPVELAELENLQRQNKITFDTPVWTEGMADWVPYQKSSALPAGALSNTQVCAECRQRFPESEMLHYENSWVCAACKPIFFQKIKEGVAPRFSLVFSGVGRRFVALFLDGIFIEVALFVPIFMILGLAGFLKPQSAGVSPAFIITMIGVYLIPPLYEIIFIGKWGATLGKMVMGVKVVAPDGSRISYARSTGRYFAKMLSGLILCIGYLMAFWDDERRALHDQICNTRVIRTFRS
jgi:uncharacterized RDD family membrane protein YckC